MAYLVLIFDENITDLMNHIHLVVMLLELMPLVFLMLPFHSPLNKVSKKKRKNFHAIYRKMVMHKYNRKLGVKKQLRTKINEPITPTTPRKLATPVNEIATGIFEDMTGLLFVAH